MKHSTLINPPKSEEKKWKRLNKLEVEEVVTRKQLQLLHSVWY